jgi:DNA-binding XRE family transcriptional regulator
MRLRVDREKVRALRNKGSESQEALAHRVGITHATMRNIETGRVKWPYHLTLRALAEALGTTVADITTADPASGSGDDQPPARPLPEQRVS